MKPVKEAIVWSLKPPHPGLPPQMGKEIGDFGRKEGKNNVARVPGAGKNQPAMGEGRAGAGKNPWLKLAMGIVLILLFIFGFGRISRRIPGADRMARVIDDYDLRPSAIFYTDFEAPAESAEYIRHSLEYAPRSRPPK